MPVFKGIWRDGFDVGYRSRQRKRCQIQTPERGFPPHGANPDLIQIILAQKFLTQINDAVGNDKGIRIHIAVKRIVSDAFQPFRQG